MLIRSQNNKSIMPLHNIAEIFVCVSEIHVQLVTDDLEIIGTYSSEEKCIKVLDKLEYHASLNHALFQMPADEEVEE